MRPVREMKVGLGRSSDLAFRTPVVRSVAGMMGEVLAVLAVESAVVDYLVQYARLFAVTVIEYPACVIGRHLCAHQLPLSP